MVAPWLALLVMADLAGDPLAASEVPPAGGVPAAASHDAPSAEDALGLADCFRLALARSESVGRASAAVDLERALRRRTRSALMPQLSLRDDFSQQEKVDLGSSGVGGAFSFEDQRNQVYVSLTQPLLAPLASRPLLRAGRESVEAAAHAREDAERALLLDVAGAFHAVLQLEKEALTLGRATRGERDRLEETSARREVGLARRTEVLLIRSQLSSHESRLVRAQNDLAAARAALASLTGASPDAPLADDMPLPPGEESGGIAARPSWSRADLMAAEARVRAAEAELSAFRRAALPRLDLGADWYLDRSGYSTFAQETDWSAELLLTVPLFTGGRYSADVAAARARLTEQQLLRDELSRGISLEVQQLGLALASDQAEMGMLADALESAREAYDLSREELRAGLATSLEVLTAERQLLDAELAADSQRHRIMLSWIALQLARGAEPEDVVKETPR